MPYTRESLVRGPTPFFMHYPWLFLNLLTREIRNRYVGSASGLFWLVLHPMILLGLYAVVFSFIFKVKLPGLETEGFVTFVAIGLWPWLAFQEAVQRGATALTGNAALIKKAAFPREMVVWAASGSHGATPPRPLLCPGSPRLQFVPDALRQFGLDAWRQQQLAVPRPVQIELSAVQPAGRQAAAR